MGEGSRDCWCRGSTATTITAVCALGVCVCVCVCLCDIVNELEWKWGCVMAHKSDEMTSPLLEHTAAIAAKNALLRYLAFYFLWSEVSARLSCSPLISYIHTMTALCPLQTDFCPFILVSLI